MKQLLILLLVGSALSAPTSDSSESNENEKLIINEEFFPNEFKVHTAKHDIVQIVVPLNALNYDDSSEGKTDDRSTLFFVEADINNGVKEYKGLSIMRNDIVTKLLDTGTDISADNGESKTAYISATNGLYMYDVKENKAVKYGPITDNLIGIAKVNGSDVIYVLTANNEVYKVTDNGTKKVKVDKIVGAKQIVLDYANNLYYYGEDKKPYVFNGEEVKEIEGLPSNPTTVELIKPAFVIEDGVPFIVDNKAYIIYANGSNELTSFEFEVKPTAYGMEAALIQYFGYNKSIYEYNVLLILLGETMDQIKNYLNDRANEIQTLASRPQSLRSRA